MTSASSLARARRSLADEAQLLDSLLRAHQLQHRRALYMPRLLDVRRRLKAVLLSCEEPSLRAGRVQHAVDAAELALERIAPAWLALRELLAQTYFMPFALCHLALLSKAATLVAQLHAGLCASYHGVAGRARPALLALYHAPDATTALSRVFGSEAAGGAKSGLSSSEGLAAQPSLPQTLAEDLGEAEDLGQVEEAPCVEESIAPAAINSQDEGMIDEEELPENEVLEGPVASLHTGTPTQVQPVLRESIEAAPAHGLSSFSEHDTWTTTHDMRHEQSLNDMTQENACFTEAEASPSPAVEADCSPSVQYPSLHAPSSHTVTPHGHAVRSTSRQANGRSYQKLMATASLVRQHMQRGRHRKRLGWLLMLPRPGALFVAYK